MFDYYDNCDSYYGNYRTRKFSDIFNKAEEFQAAWKETPFSTAVEDIDVELVFFLLYAHYGNSSIASSDENQFKYKLFSYVYQYAPNWQKEMSVQKELRALNIEDLRQGATSIMNNANNPSGAPATNTKEALPFINNQNVSITERGIADGYAVLMSLLKNDITEIFVNRFSKLFLTIVAPQKPLWYVDYPTEE